MTKSEFYDLIWDETGMQRDRITDDSRFIEDLGCDSLDTVEIVMSLEEALSVDIPDELAERWFTVGQVWEWVEGQP